MTDADEQVARSVNADAKLVSAAIRNAVEPLDVSPLGLFIGLLSSAGGAALTALSSAPNDLQRMSAAGLFASHFRTSAQPFQRVADGEDIEDVLNVIIPDDDGRGDTKGH